MFYVLYSKTPLNSLASEKLLIRTIDKSVVKIKQGKSINVCTYLYTCLSAPAPFVAKQPPPPRPVEVAVELPIPPKFLEPLKNMSVTEGSRVTLEGVVQGKLLSP